MNGWIVAGLVGIGALCAAWFVVIGRAFLLDWIEAVREQAWGPVALGATVLLLLFFGTLCLIGIAVEPRLR